uniref:Uncharacterized protein n=1 Tax=Paramormyrops kingsleyae TaxID=1676925 RepID=A0A3B3T922_9TELE
QVNVVASQYCCVAQSNTMQSCCQGSSVPSKQNEDFFLWLLRTIFKFDEASSVVNAPKTGRPRISVTGENEMRVLTFMNSLKKSTWRVSQELSIPRMSMTTQIFGCKNQIWSDEARSKLSGYVNRYNCLNQPGITVADYNNYLDNIFPQYWIRRCGSIDWLTRSPDLTSRDGFWGGVKEKVLRRFPNSELFIARLSGLDARTANCPDTRFPREALTQVANPRGIGAAGSLIRIGKELTGLTREFREYSTQIR